MTVIATDTISPPLKWHGGKAYLAKRLIDLMPARCANPNAPDADDRGWLHYVEPFAGGLAVLLAQDPEGISEVANDLNGWLMNFWRVLQTPSLFEAFGRQIEASPFAEPIYLAAKSMVGNVDLSKLGASVSPVDAAVWFFICCRQSLAGRMESFAPLSRTRTRRGMNEQSSAWLNAIEGLPQVHRRLIRVAMLQKDAVEVIRQQDGPRTLNYIDPPYTAETRTSPNVYAHEMDAKQHARLLDALLNIKGRFLLSGYDCAQYREFAERGNWNRHEFDLPNNAAGGDSKRRMIEVVWTNY